MTSLGILGVCSWLGTPLMFCAEACHSPSTRLSVLEPSLADVFSKLSSTLLDDRSDAHSVLCRQALFAHRLDAVDGGGSSRLCDDGLNVVDRTEHDAVDIFFV